MWNRRRRQADKPSPPTNARAVLDDGTEIPLECFYVGVSDTGAQQWAATIGPTDSRVVELVADTIPANTSLTFRVFHLP